MTPMGHGVHDVMSSHARRWPEPAGTDALRLTPPCRWSSTAAGKGAAVATAVAAVEVDVAAAVESDGGNDDGTPSTGGAVRSAGAGVRLGTAGNVGAASLGANNSRSRSASDIIGVDDGAGAGAGAVVGIGTELHATDADTVGAGSTFGREDPLQSMPPVAAVYS